MFMTGVLCIVCGAQVYLHLVKGVRDAFEDKCQI